MEVGVSIDQTDQDQITAYLEKSLDNQHGVVGFSTCHLINFIMLCANSACR
jgi:hypothetical protein